jgi:hypothetical protein
VLSTYTLFVLSLFLKQYSLKLMHTSIYIVLGFKVKWGIKHW